MDSWQEWIVLVVGFVVSKISWDQRQDKMRTDSFRDKTNEKISAINDRITRVEAEIVTEREVREVLHELIAPFISGLEKIELKQDTIASDIIKIRLAIVAIPERYKQ